MTLNWKCLSSLIWAISCLHLKNCQRLLTVVQIIIHFVLFWIIVFILINLLCILLICYTHIHRWMTFLWICSIINAEYPSKRLLQTVNFRKLFYFYWCRYMYVINIDKCLAKGPVLLANLVFIIFFFLNGFFLISV